MQFKDHLIELFKFNDTTNKRLFRKIGQLDDPQECVKFASHLINCQYKWMARIVEGDRANEMSWWDPLYSLNQLEGEWDKSLKPWLDFIDSSTDRYLGTECEFLGFDGGEWAATPKDIALQLNFHSIHHRAQIQTIIRAQGLEPDFVDYKGSKADH